MLLPITAWFYMKGDVFSVSMAVAATMFFLSAIRATKVVASAHHQNFMKTRELKISKDIAEKQARIDELTGLHNRRAFYEHAEICTNYSQHHQETLAVILIDIDHFKNINDTMGHAAGDAALEHIGNIFSKMTRKSDIFARTGGDEFTMLLMATTIEEATQLAEKLSQKISKAPVQFNNEEFLITASFGVAAGELDVDVLLKRADAAMYQAKETGRNTVISDKLEDQ